MMIVFIFIRGGDVGFPFVSRQEDFLIVPAWLALGLDPGESILAGKRAAAQIRHGHRMSVHVTEPGRRGRKAVTQMTVRPHGETALFLGAIKFGRHIEAVPMNEFGSVSVVE